MRVTSLHGHDYSTTLFTEFEGNQRIITVIPTQEHYHNIAMVGHQVFRIYFLSVCSKGLVCLGGSTSYKID